MGTLMGTLIGDGLGTAGAPGTPRNLTLRGKIAQGASVSGRCGEWIRHAGVGERDIAGETGDDTGLPARPKARTRGRVHVPTGGPPGPHGPDPMAGTEVAGRQGRASPPTAYDAPR